MKSTVFLLATTIVGYGFWGFFSKLATDRIGSQIMIWNGLAFLLTGIVYLAAVKDLLPLKISQPGMTFALLSGLSIGIGSASFYILLKKEPAGFIVTAAALYPLITILLSIAFLGEKITLLKGIGFIFAIVALVLLNL